MGKKKTKISQQARPFSLKEKVSELVQGSFGALLEGALQEGKKLHRQSTKTKKCQAINDKAHSSRAEDAELLKEFEKMASQGEAIGSAKELEMPAIPETEVKTIHNVVFIPIERKTTVEVDISEKQMVPVEPQHTILIKQKMPRLMHAFAKVTDKPIVLNLQKREQSKALILQPAQTDNEIFFGCRTQVQTTSSEEESDIIIGIDFGTSSTKVVIRDQMLNQAYAVPFTSYAPEENCYLLPTSLSINQDGTMSLGPGDLHESELKLRFIHDPLGIVMQGANPDSSLNAEELFVGYLALALREIRSWFFTKTQNQYAKTNLKWNINIGIPSDNYDDKKLRARFEQATQISWYASVQQRLVDTELIKESFMEIYEANRQLSLGDISVLNEACLRSEYFCAHPEIIMEVVGYVRSPLGEQGTHLLVDVGASTLDVATFRVGRRDGEDLFPMLSCKVAELGSGMLHKKRMHMVKSKLEAALNNIYAVESVKPLPSVSKYEIGLSNNDIIEHDDGFRAECRKVIGAVVKDTKDNRDVYAEVWTSKLPVFVCGGGSKETIYKDIVQKISDDLSGSLRDFKGFKVLDIPKPETLQAPNIAPNEYMRLAVAYGLSFSNDEIGEIIPQSSVEDNRVTVKNIDYGDRYVGPEQM
jgi:hypothetical protein